LEKFEEIKDAQLALRFESKASAVLKHLKQETKNERQHKRQY
jgi:hypothetical protein